MQKPFTSCRSLSGRTWLRSARREQPHYLRNVSQASPEEHSPTFHSAVDRLTATARGDSRVAPVALVLLLGLTVWTVWEPNSSAQAQELQSQFNNVADVAQNEEFWSNVARYGRYFVTVMLGTGYVMLKPLEGMLKRPLTAIAAISAVVALFIFVKFTLDAMLGISEPFDYTASNIASL